MSHPSCLSCRSANQREFTAEMNIHFPGMKGLDVPAVLIFPSILVCLDCGTGQFRIPEAQRRELADQSYRDFVDGAAV